MFNLLIAIWRQIDDSVSVHALLSGVVHQQLGSVTNDALSCVPKFYHFSVITSV